MYNYYYHFNSNKYLSCKSINNKSLPGSGMADLEVYFSFTEDLNSKSKEFARYLSYDELRASDLLRSDEDWITYMSCHAILRIILARKFKTKPLEILIIRDVCNKPKLADNSLSFNITHTRNAFAFAIAKDFYVGIDLERVSWNPDFNSIIKSYFSKGEQEFIATSQNVSSEKFFLLWTRKEAFLKAIGTGIMTDLKQVEVYKGEELKNRELFDSLFNCITYNKHFIYSKKLSNYYLSIVTPQKANIAMKQINEENLKYYFNSAC